MKKVWLGNTYPKRLERALSKKIRPKMAPIWTLLAGISVLLLERLQCREGICVKPCFRSVVSKRMRRSPRVGGTSIFGSPLRYSQS